MYDDVNTSTVSLTAKIESCTSVSEDSSTSMTAQYTLGAPEEVIVIASLNPLCPDSDFFMSSQTEDSLPDFIIFEAQDQSMTLTVFTDDILDDGTYTLQLIEKSRVSGKEAIKIVRLSVTD